VLPVLRMDRTDAVDRHDQRYAVTPAGTLPYP
jgi:hypothetical protein